MPFRSIGLFGLCAYDSRESDYSTKKLDKELLAKQKEVIAMKKRGINLFFTDVDMILELMNRLE